MEHSIQAVLLTGGASRRMGTDKAGLRFQGEPMGLSIARRLATVCSPVTVLGREPIAGFDFLADAEAYAGPLAALARLTPQRELVFVCSCDVPFLEPALIHALANRLRDQDAVVPVLQGRAQPLCALYRANSLNRIPEGEPRVMRWLAALNILEITEVDEPLVTGCRNVNTPSDLTG